MVAFNFKKDFAPKILIGEKTSTIRSKQRCKVGDTMHLFTGQRTKACKRLMTTTCVGVGRITINKYTWALHEFEGELYTREHEVLSAQEGFENLQAMLDFFDKQYGLPYTGYIHVWQPPEAA